MPKFTVDGIQLHYEDRGEGPVLLLIHGLGSSSMDWENQYPHFESKLRMIAPDLRGFGRSDKPAGPYTVMRQAADIVALLDHLSIDRVAVLGFSMGGAVAFQLAAKHADRVDRLIIVNSSPSFVTDTWKKRLEVVIRKGVIHLLGVEKLAILIAKRLFPDPDQASLRSITVERYGKNQKQAYIHAIDGIVGWELSEEELRGLSMPVLVIAAASDYTPIAEKKRYCSLLSNAELVVVENSRHATPIDQTQIFNGLVDEFLQPITGGRQGSAGAGVESSSSPSAESSSSPSV